MARVLSGLRISGPASPSSRDIDDRLSKLVGVPRAFGVACHPSIPFEPFDRCRFVSCRSTGRIGAPGVCRHFIPENNRHSRCDDDGSRDDGRGHGVIHSAKYALRNTRFPARKSATIKLTHSLDRALVAVRPPGCQPPSISRQGIRRTGWQSVRHLVHNPINAVTVDKGTEAGPGADSETSHGFAFRKFVQADGNEPNAPAGISASPRGIPWVEATVTGYNSPCRQIFAGGRSTGSDGRLFVGTGRGTNRLKKSKVAGLPWTRPIGPLG